MIETPQLHVAMYHYVRDLSRTRFPKIKGMLLDEFRRQVKALPDHFEMATLNSALDFLSGKYRPRRDLCLLTFDDGLKEHYAEVTPILADAGIQAAFFLISGCLEDSTVAPVHMNHFLMAGLGLERYRDLFLEAIRALGVDERVIAKSDLRVARRTYPLDDSATAKFKYLFNFRMPARIRDQAVKDLFVEYIGNEAEFSSNLYVSWAEAREMQRAGMAIGGHSHEHRPLATLNHGELEWDLGRCCALIRTNLEPQEHWPFCYPYGKSDSFNPFVIDTLRRLGFHCAFCTEPGANLPGTDFFTIRRVDCKKITPVGRQRPAIVASAEVTSVSATSGQ